MTSPRPSTDAAITQPSHRVSAKDFKNAVINVKLRSKTTPSEIFTDDITAEKYGWRLFDKLRAGLESHNFSTLHLALRHYKWLLPMTNASPDVLAIFDQVCVAAPTVTCDALAKIMTMEESRITSPLGTDGWHYFYVRELVLTGEELGDVVDYMRNSDDDFEETSEWSKMLQRYGIRGPVGFDTWTLRYVGTVEGPRRPVDCFEDDRDFQLANILGETYRAIENVCPHVMRNTKVYLLPDATIYPDSITTVRDTERLLVQLFHHPSLLNRQLGSHQVHYGPNPDQVDEFMALGTDAWQSFESNARGNPVDMCNDLVAHFESVQEYANKFPAESGTAIHPFTDEVRWTAFQQSQPSQFRNTTIITFLGMDITVSDYTKARSFWRGGSQAGELTKGILHRTVDSEMESHGRGYRREIRDQFSLWCYADLWPWLWHKNEKQAMGFLCSYLNIIRPLIAVSYGRHVNSVTKTDFQLDRAVLMSSTCSFTDTIGEPSIQYYDHHDHRNRSHQECAYINIPHLHPGRAKYGRHDLRLRYLLEITMQETFVIISLALKMLDKHANDEIAPSRLALCEEILYERECLNRKPEYKKFSDSLIDARTQCKLYFSSIETSSPHD